MKEAVKIFANKTKKSNALDLEYQNRKKKQKNQRFDSGYFLDKIDFEDDGT